MQVRSTWCCIVAWFCALLLPLHAQQAPNQLTLSQLASQAGLIFSGTVLRVEHVAPATENGIGTVRVTFRIDQGIRGVHTGEWLTIAEWDGLWTSGERYRSGESLVLFLHAPSGELGLTSPVGGLQGRISLQEAVTATRRPFIRERQLLRNVRRAARE